MLGQQTYAERMVSLEVLLTFAENLELIVVLYDFEQINNAVMYVLSHRVNF